MHGCGVLRGEEDGGRLAAVVPDRTCYVAEAHARTSAAQSAAVEGGEGGSEDGEGGSGGSVEASGAETVGAAPSLDAAKLDTLLANMAALQTQVAELRAAQK